MPLSIKSVEGPIASPLTYTAEQEYFGAQVLDITFLDVAGEAVSPTEGTYVVQYSANGRHWSDFEGTFFPAKVGQAIEDWQAAGVVRYLRVVPVTSIVGADSWRIDFRLHGIGMPGLTSRAQSSNRYFSTVNVTQISGFEQSVLQGNALASSTKINVPANSTYSVKIVKNADTAVVFVNAFGLFISFVDGDVSGNLIELTGGGRLNTLEDFQFQSALEFYDGPATGDRIATDKDRLNVAFILNGGGVVELVNDTNEDIMTYFSIGEVAISDPITPYMLLPTIQIEANTEMSTYNGAN